MPAAVPALFGYIAYVVTGYALVGAVVAAGVGMLINNKRDYGDRSAMRQGVLDNFNSTSSPIPVLYGTRRMGGPRVFVDVTGPGNEWIHIVIVWCEGEVASIDTVYLDGRDATSIDVAALTTVTNYTGTDSQTADPNLVSDFTDWTSMHRLRGVAYSVIKIQFDRDVFPNGVPVITADITGKKVYDPRTSTTSHSNNPALCVRDYITNTRYGIGVDTTELDDPSFEDAADYCETTVSVPPSGTQQRYTCDGYVDTDGSPMDNLNELLGSCRGMIIFTGGKYRMVIDKAETPAFTLDESNLVGQWSISLDTRANRLNRIRAEFYNPLREWQKDTRIVDSPTFRTNDNEDLLESQVILPFTADAYTAQQIAGIELRQSRYQAAIEVTATIEALRCEVGDVVNLTHEVPGWTDKPMRVIDVGLTDADNVSLRLLEYDSSVYTLDSLNAEDTPPGTSLPDPWDVAAPTSLVITPQAVITTDGTTISQFDVSWTASADAFIVGYEVEYKKTADSNYVGVRVPANDLDYLITPVEADTSYDIRVRAVSGDEATSNWLSDTDTSIGDTTAPGSASGLASASDIVNAVTWTWTSPTDADLSHVEVWVASGTNDRSSAALAARVAGESITLDYASGTTRYAWVRPVDLTGNAGPYFPTSSTAGVAGNARAPDLFDDDAFFSEIKPILQFSWRMGFEDREYSSGEWIASAATMSRDSTNEFAGTYCGQFAASSSLISSSVYRKFTADELAILRGRRAQINYMVRDISGSNSYRVGLYDLATPAWRGYVEESTPATWTNKQVIGDTNIPDSCTDLRFYVYPDRTDGNGTILLDAISVTAVSDIIDASNITNWMASAAITEAYIGSLAVTNAKIALAAVETANIKDLNVRVLKVADEHITVGRVAASTTVSVTGTTNWEAIHSVVLPATPDSASRGTVVVEFSCSGWNISSYNFRIRNTTAGTTLMTTNAALNYQYPMTIRDTDSPSTAANTYAVQVNTGIANLTFRDVVTTVQELRK